MTKIQITSKWSEVKPRGFYVYIHRRVADGEIFYVGKGKDNRAWTTSRNRYWKRVARKHGVVVEICQDGLVEDDAFLLEAWLIAKNKRYNKYIVNSSMGGEGPSGMKQSRSSNIKRSKSLLRFHSENTIQYPPRVSSRVPIMCSNGMVFSGAPDAVDWLVSDNGVDADQRNISACVNGHRRVAYGFGWAKYDGGEVGPFEVVAAKTTNTPSRILRSDGSEFDSLSSAIDHLKLEGHNKASIGTLSMAARGVRKSAYGYTWKYA